MSEQSKEDPNKGVLTSNFEDSFSVSMTEDGDMILYCVCDLTAETVDQALWPLVAMYRHALDTIAEQKVVNKYMFRAKELSIAEAIDAQIDMKKASLRRR